MDFYIVTADYYDEEAITSKEVTSIIRAENLSEVGIILSGFYGEGQIDNIHIEHLSIHSLIEIPREYVKGIKDLVV